MAAAGTHPTPTSDKARRPMGGRGIREQRTPETLKGLSNEIRKAEDQAASAPKGDRAKS